MNRAESNDFTYISRNVEQKHLFFVMCELTFVGALYSI